MIIECIFTECICDVNGHKCSFGYEPLGYDKECSDSKVKGFYQENGRMIFDDICQNRNYVRQAFSKEYKRFEFSEASGLEIAKKYIPIKHIEYLKIGDMVMVDELKGEQE